MLSAIAHLPLDRDSRELALEAGRLDTGVVGWLLRHVDEPWPNRLSANSWPKLSQEIDRCPESGLPCESFRTKLRIVSGSCPGLRQYGDVYSPHYVGHQGFWSNAGGIIALTVLA